MFHGWTCHLVRVLHVYAGKVFQVTKQTTEVLPLNVYFVQFFCMCVHMYICIYKISSPCDLLVQHCGTLS